MWLGWRSEWRSRCGLAGAASGTVGCGLAGAASGTWHSHCGRQVLEKLNPRSTFVRAHTFTTTTKMTTTTIDIQILAIAINEVFEVMHDYDTSNYDPTELAQKLYDKLDFVIQRIPDNNIHQTISALVNVVKAGLGKSRCNQCSTY